MNWIGCKLDLTSVDFVQMEEWQVSSWAEVEVEMWRLSDQQCVWLNICFWLKENGRFIQAVRRGAVGNPPWRGFLLCSWWDRFIFNVLSDHWNSMAVVKTHGRTSKTSGWVIRRNEPMCYKISGSLSTTPHVRHDAFYHFIYLTCWWRGAISELFLSSMYQFTQWQIHICMC